MQVKTRNASTAESQSIRQMHRVCNRLDADARPCCITARPSKNDRLRLKSRAAIKSALRLCRPGVSQLVYQGSSFDPHPLHILLHTIPHSHPRKTQQFSSLICQRVAPAVAWGFSSNLAFQIFRLYGD